MRSAFRLPDWSLRARLLALLVALAVVGLAAADFASYRALHGYLYDRVDQQLESAVVPLSIRLSHHADGQETPDFGPGPGPGGGGPGPSGGLPSGTYGQLRTAAGEVIAHTPARLFGEELPLPQIPTDLEPTMPEEAIAPITVGARCRSATPTRRSATWR
jgi:hypothetical protein